MLKQFIQTILVSTCISANAFAFTAANTHSMPSPYYIGAYGGYGTISGGYDNDGNTAQGRFVLGMNMQSYRSMLFGGELGLQSGNTMRLDASSSVVSPSTGVYPQAVLQPILDLLGTMKGQFNPDTNLFYILKAGVAYRQMHLQDRTASTDSLNKIAPELQLGLGLSLTEHALLTVVYQGIYSNSNAGVTVDSAGNTSISNIPTQQAGFLGIEYVV